MRTHVDADLTDAALDELTSYTTFTVEGGIEAAERLLDLGVTGFVCGSDIIAWASSGAPGNGGCGFPRTSRSSVPTTP